MKEFNPEKEYKKLNRKFTKKHLLIITSVVLVLTVIGISFANYSVNPNSILIIDSKVGEFTTGDITISVLVDGEKKDKFPTKEENKDYLGIECKNGSTASFDYTNWKLKLEATGPDVCTVKFGSTYCTENSDSLLCKDKSQLAFDDPDNNLRFIGADPNNYVTFNAEKWRIIGAFDMYECDDNATTSDYTNKCSTKKLLKIIRNESIGGYSWDSSETAVNNGYGVNEWRLADLNTLLNDYYYNSKSGQKCYKGSSNSQTNCSFDTTGIKEENRDMIANVLWYTGTIGDDWSQSTTTSNYEKSGAKAFYDGERSEHNGKICSQGGSDCNDSESRSTKWIGKVGLMYPSDYGYSIGNAQRTECLATSLYNYSSCASSSWLFMSGTYQWTITPVPYGSLAYYAFRVNSSGYVRGYHAYYAIAVRPVVYLKSNVQITGGDGTSGNPYTLGM